MPQKNVEINSKKIQLMKAITSAKYDEKTVLTNSVWEYVDLWLRRQKSDRAKHALFYWSQAKNFFNASEQLTIEAKPLTSYYCCLNATKALLVIKGDSSIKFDGLSHGVTSDHRGWVNNNFQNINICFLGAGVLFELSKYLSEDCNKINYTIYDLLYDIPCVHRAFSITYSTTELFIPIKETAFVYDTNIKKDG